MKIEKEVLEKNCLKLSIEIEPDEVEQALNQAYRQVVKDLKMPGFRKGKIPRKILEARLGKDVLHQDALEILVPKALMIAIREHDVEPIDRPELKSYEIDEGQPGKLELTIEVKPEVELGKYTGLEVEKEKVEIEEEQVEQVLENIRDQQATLMASEKELVEDEDYVVIDFTGYLDGEPVEGASGEDFVLNIGSNTFVPGFEKQLIGARVGEEKEIKVTFPEDYREESLAGQEVRFEVKIKEIKEKELPSADDDLAKTVGEYETIEELKDDVREKIEEEARDKVRVKFENDVMDAVAGNVTLEVPEKMVEDRVEEIYRETASSMEQRGMKMEDYLAAIGSSVDDWKEKNKPAAERQVRNRLILEKVVAEEGIEAKPEEIDEEIEKIIEGTDFEFADFKQRLEAQGYLTGIGEDIKRRKALELLMEKNEARKE